MKTKFLYLTISEDCYNLLCQTYSLCLNGFMPETKE